MLAGEYLLNAGELMDSIVLKYNMLVHYPPGHRQSTNLSVAAV